MRSLISYPSTIANDIAAVSQMADAAAKHSTPETACGDLRSIATRLRAISSAIGYDEIADSPAYAIEFSRHHLPLYNVRASTSPLPSLACIHARILSFYGTAETHQTEARERWLIRGGPDSRRLPIPADVYATLRAFGVPGDD